MNRRSVPLSAEPSLCCRPAQEVLPTVGAVNAGQCGVTDGVLTDPAFLV